MKDIGLTNLHGENLMVKVKDELTLSGLGSVDCPVRIRGSV